jgi:hypothetical protein
MRWHAARSVQKREETSMTSKSITDLAVGEETKHFFAGCQLPGATLSEDERF